MRRAVVGAHAGRWTERKVHVFLSICHTNVHRGWTDANTVGEDMVELCKEI